MVHAVFSLCGDDDDSHDEVAPKDQHHHTHLAAAAAAAASPAPPPAAPPPRRRALQSRELLEVHCRATEVGAVLDGARYTGRLLVGDLQCDDCYCTTLPGGGVKVRREVGGWWWETCSATIVTARGCRAMGAVASR